MIADLGQRCVVVTFKILKHLCYQIVLMFTIYTPNPLKI